METCRVLFTDATPVNSTKSKNEVCSSVPWQPGNKGYRDVCMSSPCLVGDAAESINRWLPYACFNCKRFKLRTEFHGKSSLASRWQDTATLPSWRSSRSRGCPVDQQAGSRLPHPPPCPYCLLPLPHAWLKCVPVEDVKYTHILP